MRKVGAIRSQRRNGPSATAACACSNAARWRRSDIRRIYEAVLRPGFEAPSYRGAASKQNGVDRRSARPVWGGGNETAKTRARMRRGNEWVRAGLFDI